jgi:hypothetical protein
MITGYQADVRRMIEQLKAIRSQRLRQSAIEVSELGAMIDAMERREAERIEESNNAAANVVVNPAFREDGMFGGVQ